MDVELRTLPSETTEDHGELFRYEIWVEDQQVLLFDTNGYYAIEWYTNSSLSDFVTSLHNIYNLENISSSGIFLDGERKTTINSTFNKIINNDSFPESCTQLTLEFGQAGFETAWIYNDDPSHRIVMSGEDEKLTPFEYLYCHTYTYDILPPSCLNKIIEMTRNTITADQHPRRPEP